MNLGENTESQESQDPARDPPDPPLEISLRSNAASLTFLVLSGQTNQNT